MQINNGFFDEQLKADLELAQHGRQAWPELYGSVEYKAIRTKLHQMAIEQVRSLPLWGRRVLYPPPTRPRTIELPPRRYRPHLLYPTPAGRSRPKHIAIRAMLWDEGLW